jgi:hypothetical protein
LTFAVGIITQKQQQMGSTLYTVAVVLIMIWAVAYIGYNASGLIHGLLGLAVAVIILQLIRKT